jgi:hypothetical protein
MDISLFGIKLNLEVLILIGIVYLILVSHTVCGCCNMHGIMEAFGSKNSSSSSNSKHGSSSSSSSGGHGSYSGHSSSGSSSSSSNSNLKHLAAAQILKEGFSGANTNYGQSAPYTLGQNTPVDTSLWGQPDLVVTPGQPLSPGVQAILNREPQPVPLPEGEMLMFANTPFKPECCPNTFSQSGGCACLTSEQYNYIGPLRGGNNVPYSEY